MYRLGSAASLAGCSEDPGPWIHFVSLRLNVPNGFFALNQFTTMCAARPLDESALVHNQSLAEWVGMSAVKPTAAPSGSTVEVAALISPMQAFFAWAGVGPNDHYRSLASLATDDWAAALMTFEVNGAKPTIGQKAHAVFFHATARRLCKLDPWPDAQLHAPPTPVAQTSQQPTSGFAHSSKNNLSGN